MRFAVTPYAGVWIEISENKHDHRNTRSLPTRECGLKLLFSVCHKPDSKVTPYAGVWIEIEVNANDKLSATSLPTRECGLKSITRSSLYATSTSLPTRECGLKFLVQLFLPSRIASLPTRECGLKSVSADTTKQVTCHSLRGSVD